VSGYGTEDHPAARPKDPVYRFLAGCALVVAILAAIVVGVSLLLGWRLARDESPGRERETFLVGDETRYWCIDLKPEDAGLVALFKRIDDMNDASRRSLLRGTFLEALPLPRRRARLDELAPFTLELAQSMIDPASGPPVPKSWAARGTFSHGLFRMRVALKLIRFFASRNTEKSDTIDVDGVAVTEVHDRNTEFSFAFATVGNRVLVASDSGRVRTILERDRAQPASRLPELLDLHRQVALDGEDAWAVASTTRLPGLSRPPILAGAAASFDVNDRDELAFRVIVAEASPSEEGDRFAGTPEECLAVVSSLLPGVPAAAIEIAEGGAVRSDHGTLEFSGRVAGLSKRLAEIVAGATAFRWGGPGRPPFAPETPSASPIPPTPPPPSGPRSDTPGGPTREGSPRPPR
jgi:hypothetical protein